MRSINQAIALLFILAVGMCFLVLEARYTTAFACRLHSADAESKLHSVVAGVSGQEAA